MSTTIHNAIIITTWNRELAFEIQSKIEHLGLNISAIIESKVNGYSTILVGPDGSKDGWEQDLFGDKVRQEIVYILNSYAHEDGSTPIEWIDIAYGNDFQRDKIEAMMKAPDIQENQNMNKAYTLENTVTKEVFQGEDGEGVMFFDSDLPYLTSEKNIKDLLDNFKQHENEYAVSAGEKDLVDDAAKTYINQLKAVPVNYEVVVDKEGKK